jgi:membrane peptidoglycan carboxypeptidase
MNIKRPNANRARRSVGHEVTTRSGNVLKVNRGLGSKWLGMRAAKARRRVDRLRGLPKSRFKRFFWKLHPKRLAAYWFSRDGAIMALKLGGLFILLMFVMMLSVFAYFRKDLPNIADISGSNLGGSISYYDKTGTVLLWQDYNGVKRVPVESKEISQYMKDATIATEDRNFYNEKGFAVRGIARAFINNTIKKGGTQGGSTITQQLVKLTQDWTEQRTVSRKVKELILSVELERSYTKDEILTGYLNIAPYGGVDHGVQTAASDYFHKNAKDLTLPEAAMLAVIPKSPSIYSPYARDYFDKPAFQARYIYVLNSMVDTGKITKAQADAAKKVDVLATVQPQQEKYAGIKAPYFVLAAKNEILKRCLDSKGNCSAGGWKVITTLDMNLQNIAEKVVQDNRKNALSHGADAEALVAEDVKTGQMVALVGGTDFTNEDYGKINYAQWNVSPGSSFKPYDYATLIENNNNAGAGSVLYDVQGALPGYPCTIKGLPPPKGTSNCLQDYDFRYPGPLTLRYALGGSRNVPAVKAMLTVGTDKVINTANDMMNVPNAYKCFNPGADVNTATKNDQSQCYGASALGDGAYLHLDNHVNGLATMARLGNAIPQTYILKIYDSKSSTKPLYEWKQPKGKQVIRPDAAYIVDDMAADPNASYLPGGYYKWHRYGGWHTAIKTGTTNNGFDGLMMAWNTKFAVGSWVGYHTRNKALSGAMEYSTTPLTRGFMTAALDSLKTTPVSWTEPSGIQKLPGYVVASHVGIGSVEPGPGTELYPSWYKAKGATTKNATIDKVSNKLATNCTPTLAKQNQGGNSSAEHFSIDIYYGAGAVNSGSSSANDDVHSCGDSPPQVTITVTDNSSGDPNVCNGSCTIAAAVSEGTHPLDDPKYPQFPGTVNFSVNGQVVKTLPTTGALSFTYTPTTSGSATITAQVIDSVLYDASDSATVNLTVGVAGPSNFTANKNGGNTNFSWSGGVAPWTVYRSSNSSAVLGCIAVSVTSCTAAIGGPGGTSFYVQDSTGSKSSSANN